MRMRLRLSRPYVNAKTGRFERKVLNPTGDFSQYYPLVFNPKRDTWFGKHVSSGDDPGSTTTWTSIRLRDRKFGNWYRRVGQKTIERARAREREDADRLSLRNTIEQLVVVRKSLTKEKAEFEEAEGDSLSENELNMLREVGRENFDGTLYGGKKTLDALVGGGHIVAKGIFRRVYATTDRGEHVLDYLRNKDYEAKLERDKANLEQRTRYRRR